MNRPLYETDEDKAREKAVARRVARHFGVEVKPTMKLAVADHWLFKAGRVFSLLEVKCRPKYSWDNLESMQTYILSERKWRDLVEACDGLQLALALAVCDGWDEVRVATWRSPWPSFDVKVGGRRDRDDALDVESVVHIPVEEFTHIIMNGE